MYFIFESDTWEDVTKIAAEETKKAILWLQKSGMVIIASKTEAAYFSQRELPNPPSVNIDLFYCQKCFLPEDAFLIR
jgi:hypothetical protein